MDSALAADSFQVTHAGALLWERVTDAKPRDFGSTVASFAASVVGLMAPVLTSAAATAVSSGVLAIALTTETATSALVYDNK
jgi:hypothetical protein